MQICADIPALATNIRFLGSLATSADETVGLLELFGPRIERLFESTVKDCPDSMAAVCAYVDLLPLDAVVIQKPKGAVLELLSRCNGVIQA